MIHTHTHDTQSQIPPPGDDGRPPRLLVVLAVFALLLGGLGVGWLLWGGEAAAPAALPRETNQDQAAQPPLLEGPSSDEPVADVAEALLPSVVQIEVGGGAGVGSGVIFDADGLILTAAHVVAGNSQVTVRLANGDRYQGEVVGADGSSDIAVVEIDASGLPAAPLAVGEELRVGQLAVAVGSPWGLDATVTAGVVSAVDRPVPGRGGVVSMIQTDAPINPGNSGGPLADRQGRVIGINVSIFSLSGANDGVGFAVPIDRAYQVAQALVEGQPVEPAFLGVSGADSESRAGALVEEVFPGTPAEEVGLRPGDLVVSIDGEPVTGIADLAAEVRSHRPGETVTLEVVRDGETLTLEVELRSRPDQP
jgi:S1-C subfamily serine protease